MIASRETLQDLAAERQLQPATLERVIRLIDILNAFGADALIGPRIALKGGTALNVFHSDLDRLSVDIDVNYVGAIEKERMDAGRPGLEDRIERLMESKGYAARRTRSVRCAPDHRRAESRLGEDQGGHLDDRCERQELRLAHSLAGRHLQNATKTIWRSRPLGRTTFDLPRREI